MIARAEHARARQHGQAIVEFLAAAVVLVPLFAAVVIVARLQDLRTTTQQAARYGAFARAFGAAPAVLESEVRVRYFGRAAAPIRADDARRGLDADTTANAPWRDALRPERPFVERATDVEVRAAEPALPGGATAVLDAVAAAADRVSGWTGGRFDVERRGYHAVQVRVRVADLPDVATARPLTVRAGAQVFGGDWSADGPAQTALRTTALAPATLLRRIRPVVAPFEWALATIEPAFRDLCLGRIDVERVPEDRLGAPGTGDTGTWRAPCP